MKWLLVLGLVVIAAKRFFTMETPIVADLWAWIIYGHYHGSRGALVGPLESEWLARIAKGTQFDPSSER